MCAADIGMKRGDCVATYAGLIMNACIYTSAAAFWGLYLCNRLQRSAGADGRGATAISVRGVGLGSLHR